MRVPRKAIVLLLLLTLFCASYVCALEVPERPQGRVTDLTGTLSSDKILLLDEKLADFERRTSNQIAVLLIPSLEGDNLEDYSIRLAEKWKIGQARKDNGVILLIVKNDRKMRIEVGYGLEGVLPDGLAGSIIRDKIAPFFRSGDYFGGIDQGLDGIIEAITRTAWPGGRSGETGRFPTWILWIVLAPLFLSVLIGLAVRKWKVPSSQGKSPRGFAGGFSNDSSDDSWGGLFWGGGRGIGGGGFFGGGGGFSGGGGGFGGGGASGGW